MGPRSPILESPASSNSSIVNPAARKCFVSESHPCGDYEKGAHIIDPHTGLIAIGARSASVIGPDGALCDALATALMVDGRDAQNWIGHPDLSEYSYWVINRDDETDSIS